MRIKYLFLILIIPSLLIFSKSMERVVIYLKNRSVVTIAPRVMEEISPSGQLSVDTKRNSITILDDSEVVTKVRELIKDLDIPKRKFLISTALTIYSQSGDSIFKNDEKVVDITNFLNKQKNVEKYESSRELFEGESGEIRYGNSLYCLRVELGGYDGVERRLRFENLCLMKYAEKENQVIFKGKGNFKEGIITSLSLTDRTRNLPLRLDLHPVMVPELVEKELK